MVLLFSSKSSFDEHSPFELRLNQTCGFYGPFAPVGDFKPILKEDQIKYMMCPNMANIGDMIKHCKKTVDMRAAKAG